MRDCKERHIEALPKPGRVRARRYGGFAPPKMPLDKATKQKVITENAPKVGDTGSAEVQIAIMQARILQITEHLRTNQKDRHSRMGLLRLVGRRRRLEGYLREKDINKYRDLVQKLGIREVKPR